MKGENEMSLTSEMNRELAYDFWNLEATEEEKDLIRKGQWKQVQDARNEIWAPGFIDWVQAIAIAEKVNRNGKKK